MRCYYQALWKTAAVLYIMDFWVHDLWVVSSFFLSFFFSSPLVGITICFLPCIIYHLYNISLKDMNDVRILNVHKRLRVKDTNNSAVNQESYERQVFQVSQRTPYLQYANIVEWTTRIIYPQKPKRMAQYLLGKIERSNAQRPETTEHGEESQAQVILRDHDGKVALTVCVTEVIAGGVLWVNITIISTTQAYKSRELTCYIMEMNYWSWDTSFIHLSCIELYVVLNSSGSFRWLKL